ncbi:MAG: methionine--tRNA ligase [Candidatus Bathyarchaeota archaeon]|nr:methionine--tRNA ligase [Candidatus Bathyarchaeota archaeon]
MSKKTLVTSALIYANGPVHIGHMVEYIQTDIYVRFLKLTGRDVAYCGADDTHGAPIEINASKQGISPEEFIEHWWKEHKRDYDDYLVEFDSYHSTNSEENRYYTELIFKRLQDNGHIYTKEIELTYCENCNRYLPDRYVKGTCPKCGAQDQYGDVCEKCNSTYNTTELINSYCSICGATPIRRNSLHYFFKLSEFSDKLKRWLIGNHRLQPEIRNQILSWIKEGLEDWCISRDGPYFGFKIPDSEDKYFYVWLDAPIGYIGSTANYCIDKPFTADDYWQKDEAEIIHFIGKDIIYFHLLFWPAILMGSGFHVPDNIVVHGFLTVNGEKMSKSRGTFLTAEEFKEYLDPELLRFYYAANLSHTMTDIDLDLKNVENRINNELVSNLANLIYRVMSFTNKYYGGQITKVNDPELLKEVKEKCQGVRKAYGSYEFRDAVNRILEISSVGNKYFQDKKPWELVKSDKELGQRVLTDCVNIVKNLTVMVKPILPLFAAKIEGQLNLGELKWSDTESIIENHKVNEAQIILKKIDPIEIKAPAPKASERKIEFTIDDKLTKLGVDVKLAVVEGVDIKKSSSELDRLKKQAAETIKNTDYTGDKIIQAYNDVYKKFKIEAESPVTHLINLVKENGRLPTINTVVDSYNIVAASKRVSVGVHDLDKVTDNVRLKVTQGNEVYIPLGETERMKVPPGKFAMVDDEHVMCWLDVKQGQHTKIGYDSKNLIIYVQGNSETSGRYLDDAITEICENIVKYNGGSYRLLNPTDLSALNLKVAKVTEVLDHSGADKLYIIKIDLGDEQRQLCAGLKPYYPDRNDLLGKHLVVLTNLQPAKLRGELSEGMLLAGDDGENVGILNPQNSKPGDQVYVGDIREYKNDLIDFSAFMKYTFEAKNGKAYLEGLQLTTDAEEITLEKVTDGKIR